MQKLDGMESLRVHRDVVLTIGVFDGVHLGHQHLIGEVVRRGREIGGLAGVVTFHPHPQLVLNPDVLPAYLTTLEERLELIAGLGVDFTITLNFTPATARVTAREFVASLCHSFQLRQLCVGHDFALGYKRQGTISVLGELGAEFGYTVVPAEPWRASGVVVSSTRIRQDLRDGDVAHANRLLGRHYQVTGAVGLGDRRGHRIGFATANLETDRQLLLPADGVYAVFAEFEGRLLPAVSSIGQRPTIANAKRTFEVHILDFEGDLYGKKMTVRFVQRLRGEERFGSLDALAGQIRADVLRARSILVPTSAA